MEKSNKSVRPAALKTREMAQKKIGVALRFVKRSAKFITISAKFLRN
jgi:hypothetical protein